MVILTPCKQLVDLINSNPEKEFGLDPTTLVYPMIGAFSEDRTTFSHYRTYSSLVLISEKFHTRTPNDFLALKERELARLARIAQLCRENLGWEIKEKTLRTPNRFGLEEPHNHYLIADVEVGTARLVHAIPTEEGLVDSFSCLDGNLYDRIVVAFGDLSRELMKVN